MEKSRKLLIIHMDDIGMSYASNQAAIELFKKGIVSSGSIMMPCSWAYDFIKWARENTQYDIGIHSTLTCEWNACRWRPLGEPGKVAGIMDEEGFMWRSCQQLWESMTYSEFETEVRRQIRQAMEWGLRPTHLDNHMWTVRNTPQLFSAYVNLAKEYNLIPNVPSFLAENEEMRSSAEALKFPVVNKRERRKEMTKYRSASEEIYDALKNIRPGLNVLTIHPVIDTTEIRAIIPEWEKRYEEYKVFMDDATAEEIKELGIDVVTWKEVTGGMKIK